MADTEISPSASPSNSSSAASSAGGVYDLIFKVAGAVGAGIGVLGFVTFFGGAILWLRAEKAGLPANDAIAAVPHSVLVTTGATFLVPAVLLALLAVACIVGVHLSVGAWRRWNQSQKFKEARQARAALAPLEAQASAATTDAEAERALALSMASTAELAQTGGFNDDTKALLVAESKAQREKAEKAEADALKKVSEVSGRKAEAETKQAEAEAVGAEKEFGAQLIIGGVILLLVPPIVNGAIFHLSGVKVVILIGVAIAMMALSVATYWSTEKFVWFGIVSFVTVGLYIGFATYFSTVDNPKVEPAAALRTDRPPAVGMYIAETSSNLYLGTFPRQGIPPRLMVIPREQVTDLTIGPLLEPELARERALGLVLHECGIKIVTPRNGTEAAMVKTACDAAELAAVRKSLATGG
jgi:hypothetical protein